MSLKLKKAAISTWFVIILLPFTGTVVLAQNSPVDTSSSHPIFVHLKERPKASNMMTVSAAIPEAALVGGVPNSNTLIYNVEGDVNEAISRVEENEKVAGASEVPVWHAFDVVPQDAYANRQWALDNMHVKGSGDKAWNVFGDAATLNSQSSQVVTAVLDTGTSANHPDLAGKVVASEVCQYNGTNVVCGQGGVDDGGHGTHVAGIIAGVPDTAGIVGVGYGAKIASVKVLSGATGSGLLIEIMAGLNWVLDHASDLNIKIVNLSLGGSLSDTTVKQQLQALFDSFWQRGILVVAAAGNSGEDGNPIFYPAAFNHVLSVAALDKNNNLAPYSAYNDPAKTDPPYVTDGKWVDVAAPGGACSQSTPGDCILSAWYDASNPCSGTQGIPDESNAYCYMNGTSQAAPQVAGLAALVWARNPSLTNAQVYSLITDTANHSVPLRNNNPLTNFGAVNAYAAVSRAQSNPPQPTVTPTGVPNATVTPTRVPNATNTPTPTPIPGATNTPVPDSAVTPYPTTASAGLPKTPPDPFPQGPYCPDASGCAGKFTGDANCDGVVNNNDYNLWVSKYDQLTAGIAQNQNPNFSCVEGNSTTYFVDLIDYEVWRRGNSGL